MGEIINFVTSITGREAMDSFFIICTIIDILAVFICLMALAVIIIEQVVDRLTYDTQSNHRQRGKTRRKAAKHGNR